MSAAKPIKLSKGILYFPTLEAARGFAQHLGYPDARPVSFLKGWAMQVRKSGPYLGPNGVAP